MTLYNDLFMHHIHRHGHNVVGLQVIWELKVSIPTHIYIELEKAQHKFKHNCLESCGSLYSCSNKVTLYVTLFPPLFTPLSLWRRMHCGFWVALFETCPIDWGLNVDNLLNMMIFFEPTKISGQWHFKTI